MITHAVELNDSWAYGPGIIHGGSLVQLLAAYAVTDDHPDPLAVSTHFLAPPRVGPAEVRVEQLRAGRSVATTRVALVQGTRVCLDSTMTCGTLPDEAPTYLDAAPPVLPPVEECVRNRMPEGQPRNGIVENLDIRIEPGSLWGSAPKERAEVAAYLRPDPARDVTALDLLCLADALPPVPFAIGMRGWVPTVELTVHLRARPAPGWIRGVHRAAQIGGGWLDEDCALWDSAGRLVGQARQLAMVRA